jgi:hypothetical protein
LPVTLSNAIHSRVWPVQYELLVPSGQHHALFFKGWATFCKDAAVAPAGPRRHVSAGAGC